MRLTLSTHEVGTPSLLGIHIQEAVELLSTLNLNIRILGHKEDAELPEGTIISQTPAYEKKIKPMQSVFVVLSKKPPKIYTPHLVGKPLSECICLLEQQHIRYKLYTLTGNWPTHLCIGQHPAPQQELINHNMILYICDSAQRIVIWPSFINKSLNDCKEFLDCNDIHFEAIHLYPITIHHSCTSCIVKDQHPQPGTLVTLTPEHMPHAQFLVA